MLFEPEDLANIAPGRYFYLASPYSKWPKGIDDATKEIAKIAARLIMRQLPVYCPIAHSHVIAVAGELDPLDHGIWLPADKPIADAAAGLIVAGMHGWRESYGIGEELKWFRASGRPAYLLDIQTLCMARL